LANIHTNLSIAKEIHQETIVFDGHCDTVLEIMNHGRSLEKKKWISPE